MGADEAKLQALLEAMINIKQPQLSGPHLILGYCQSAVKAVLNRQHGMLSWQTKQLLSNTINLISRMNVTLNWLP